MPKRVLLCYHFYPPDPVVSARLFADLAHGLQARGWDVTVLTGNRFHRGSQAEIVPPEETEADGVRVCRANRPAFPQARPWGRLANSAWLQARWLNFIAREPAFDVLILGTDPQFGYAMLPAARLLRPQMKLVLWAFDLYPEALTASGLGGLARLAAWLKPLSGWCYARLDGLADLGPCMRARLSAYRSSALRATLTPWALSEPPAPLAPDPETRRALFGDAALTLLYSGTLGHAHAVEDFLRLARELRRRRAPIALCFAAEGHGVGELRARIGPEDMNIRLAEPAAVADLPHHLSAGDLHLVSLKPGWEGLVTPSKFFGALAAGRPVLYAGAAGSSLRRWIEAFQLGLVLHPENVVDVADQLVNLAANGTELARWQQRAFACYHQHFAKEAIVDGWDVFLRRVTQTSVRKPT